MSRHADGEWATCRLCHRPILWRIDPHGRPKPFDGPESDAKSHFTTCTVWREQCRRRDEAKRAEADRLQGKLF